MMLKLFFISNKHNWINYVKSWLHQPLLQIFLTQVKKRIALEERSHVIMAEATGLIMVVVEAEEGIQLVIASPINCVKSMATLL